VPESGEKNRQCLWIFLQALQKNLQGFCKNLSAVLAEGFAAQKKRNTAGVPLLNFKLRISTDMTKLLGGAGFDKMLLRMLLGCLNC
jgi:hypothetical protein